MYQYHNHVTPSVFVVDQTPKLYWNWNNHRNTHTVTEDEWQRFKLHFSAYCDGPLYSSQQVNKLGYLKCFIEDEGRKHFDKCFQHGECLSSDMSMSTILTKFEAFLVQTSVMSSGDKAACGSNSSPPANQLSNSLHNAGTVKALQEIHAEDAEGLDRSDDSGVDTVPRTDGNSDNVYMSSGDEASCGNDSSPPANQLSNSLQKGGTVKAFQEIHMERAEGLDRSDDSGVDTVPRTDGNSDNEYKLGNDITVGMAQRGEDSSYPIGRAAGEQSDSSIYVGLGEHEADIALDEDNCETEAKIHNLYTADQERSMDAVGDRENDHIHTDCLGSFGQSASLMAGPPTGPPTSRSVPGILPGGRIQDLLKTKKAPPNPQRDDIEDLFRRMKELLQEVLKGQPSWKPITNCWGRSVSQVAAGTGSGGDRGNVAGVVTGTANDVSFWKTHFIHRNTFAKDWSPRMGQTLDRHFQHGATTVEDFLNHKSFNLWECQIWKDKRMSNLLMQHPAFQNYTYGELIDDLTKLNLRCLIQEIESEVGRLNGAS